MLFLLSQSVDVSLLFAQPARDEIRYRAQRRTRTSGPIVGMKFQRTAVYRFLLANIRRVERAGLLQLLEGGLIARHQCGAHRQI